MAYWVGGDGGEKMSEVRFLHLRLLSASSWARTAATNAGSPRGWVPAWPAPRSPSQRRGSCAPASDRRRSSVVDWQSRYVQIPGSSRFVSWMEKDCQEAPPRAACLRSARARVAAERPANLLCRPSSSVPLLKEKNEKCIFLSISWRQNKRKKYQTFDQHTLICNTISPCKERFESSKPRDAHGTSCSLLVASEPYPVNLLRK